MTCADPLDEASELEQKLRDAAIAEASYQASQPRVVYDHCQWCGDPSDGNQFCCGECRDDSGRFGRSR